MKIIYCFFLVLFAAQFQLNAQNETATVYLLRPPGPDGGVPYFTYLDDELLCKVGNGRFSVHQVNAGDHQIHAQYRGKISSSPEVRLPLNLEPGKTYYVMIVVFTNNFSGGGHFCVELSETSGKKMLGLLEENKECL